MVPTIACQMVNVWDKCQQSIFVNTQGVTITANSHFDNCDSQLSLHLLLKKYHISVFPYSTNAVTVCTTMSSNIRSVVLLMLSVSSTLGQWFS